MVDLENHLKKLGKRKEKVGEKVVICFHWFRQHQGKAVANYTDYEAITQIRNELEVKKNPRRQALNLVV